MDRMITKDNFDNFKEMYEFAVQYGQKSFQFHGNEVLTSYAKYVVQFVEMQVKK